MPTYVSINTTSLKSSLSVWLLKGLFCFQVVHEHWYEDGPEPRHNEFEVRLLEVWH